ncbi:hypothetical protein WH47_11700 [Habropoda laboriosa]|uniref:Uncharacterized protein n=1 Tax=Habropoda laboriosa TaxID=597456 RepID=A0A0L7R838_9HYME|nr:hypothetical protein WH47_11700 [Habropoda laboriosa]
MQFHLEQNDDITFDEILDPFLSSMCNMVISIIDPRTCVYSHLSHTVFEGHDHTHPGITVLYEIHQRLVISSVHLVAVYR